MPFTLASTRSWYCRAQGTQLAPIYATVLVYNSYRYTVLQSQPYVLYIIIKLIHVPYTSYYDVLRKLIQVYAPIPVYDATCDSSISA